MWVKIAFPLEKNKIFLLYTKTLIISPDSKIYPDLIILTGFVYKKSDVLSCKNLVNAANSAFQPESLKFTQSQNAKCDINVSSCQNSQLPPNAIVFQLFHAFNSFLSLQRAFQIYNAFLLEVFVLVHNYFCALNKQQTK